MSLTGIPTSHYWLPLGDIVLLANHFQPAVAAIDAPETPMDLNWTFTETGLASGRHTFGDEVFWVLSPEDANARIELESTAHLPKVELEQVEYWKPETLGELLFNRWD